MTFALGLRIFTVVAMGWVVAHSARLVLQRVVGRERAPARALAGEVLTGIGALIIGWGLLPGGSVEAETTMMIAGCLVWAFGIAVEPGTRASPGI
jgi:hypothetical protein